MATLTTPKILLFDEHTAALDPFGAERIMVLTEQLIREKQLTALMITHNMKQALEYGDRLIMLHKGRIIPDVAHEKKAGLNMDDLLKFFVERDVVDDKLLLVK
jgi:putative ABC transport system ATP-binding protein